MEPELFEDDDEQVEPPPDPEAFAAYASELDEAAKAFG
jgi:hypothetical protein